MTEEPEHLARQLTAELFELSIALDLVGNAAAARIGINQTDLICLNLLASRGPMSPSQVAAALGLTTAAISAMARRLEEGGYATREIDPADRRRVVMRASPAGIERAFGLFDGMYQAAVDLFTDADSDRVRQLTALLTSYRGLLTQAAEAIREQR